MFFPFDFIQISTSIYIIIVVIIICNNNKSNLILQQYPEHEVPSGPVLAHGPYVWHLWSKWTWC